MEFQQFRIVAADNERLPLCRKPRVSQVSTDLSHTGISLREAMELHNWWLFDDPFKKTKMSFAGSKTTPLTWAEPEFNYDVRTESASLGQTPWAEPEFNHDVRTESDSMPKLVDNKTEIAHKTTKTTESSA